MIDKPDYAPAAEASSCPATVRVLHRAGSQAAPANTAQLRTPVVHPAADYSGNPATVSSLRAAATSQGSVTQLVERAVRNGLIAKTAVPGDGRSAHLHLTPIANNRIARVFAELGPERERLAEIISQHL